MKSILVPYLFAGLIYLGTKALLRSKKDKQELRRLQDIAGIPLVFVGFCLAWLLWLPGSIVFFFYDEEK